MDTKNIETEILQKSRKFGLRNKCTMFGVNLGVELNQQLTDYASKNNVSKASVIKTLLINFLNEVNQWNRWEHHQIE